MKRTIKNIGTARLARAGLFTALIVICTAVTKFSTPFGGYVHLGDGPVIMSGLVLGIFGAAPAAIGSALSDFLAGFPLFAGFSAVIKGVMAYMAGRFLAGEKRVTPRNAAIMIALFIWMIAGYFAANWAIYNLEIAVWALGGDAIQAAVGIAVSFTFIHIAPRVVRRK